MEESPTEQTLPLRVRTTNMSRAERRARERAGRSMDRRLGRLCTELRSDDPCDRTNARITVGDPRLPCMLVVCGECLCEGLTEAMRPPDGDLYRMRWRPDAAARAAFVAAVVAETSSSYVFVYELPNAGRGSFNHDHDHDPDIAARVSHGILPRMLQEAGVPPHRILAPNLYRPHMQECLPTTEHGVCPCYGARVAASAIAAHRRRVEEEADGSRKGRRRGSRRVREGPVAHEEDCAIGAVFIDGWPGLERAVDRTLSYLRGSWSEKARVTEALLCDGGERRCRAAAAAAIAFPVMRPDAIVRVAPVYCNP